MKRKRFSEAQIVGVLQEAEAGGKNQDLCRKQGRTEQTFYRWRAKEGGLRGSDITRLKQRAVENRQLKRRVAAAHLDHMALKDLLAKNWEGPRRGAKRWLIWAPLGW